MKRKILAVLLVLAVMFSMGAAKKDDEIKRMGIFISNFTELGMLDFDLEEEGPDEILHLGDPYNMGELIKFGIGHNIINNPKSTVKKCTLPGCEYGPSLMSGSSVAESVKKYFDLDVKNETVTGSPEAIFDGRSYHFDAQEWKSDAVYYEQEWRPAALYYAEVQDVRRGRGFVQMEGELYNIKKKSDRPAWFTAKAKPYRYNGKNTWAILSLSVEWK